MGLCKCPKRRVTNQFCFDHRVNVCEHCMVTNHPKCIVQSYLQWLQDSDYNPVCELCTRKLAQEDCVRLICYHVFHWACLDQFARQLPSTTAPAGYNCPTCKKALFPATNLVSPVADVLREVLAGVNWARAGLGLPLLTEDREQKPTTNVRAILTDNNTENNSITTSVRPPQITSSTSTTILHVEPDTYNRTESQTGRKIFDGMDEPNKKNNIDHDENKYKRRSAMEWFLRWWKSTMRPVSRNRSAGGLYRRYIMLAIVLILALFTLILIFSWLGKMATDNDPNLDINQNPMIHIKRS